MANDLIWREDLLKLVRENAPFIYHMLAPVTLMCPAVDVVPCRECRYWQDNNGGYPHPECRWGHGETPDPEDFCSFGERNG